MAETEVPLTPVKNQPPIPDYSEDLASLKKALQSQLISTTERIQEDTERLIEELRRRTQEELAKVSAETVTLIDQLEDAAQPTDTSAGNPVRLGMEANAQVCLTELRTRIEQQGFFEYTGIDPLLGPQVTLNRPKFDFPTLVTVNLRSGLDLNTSYSKQSVVSARSSRKGSSIPAYDANQDSRWSYYIDYDCKRLVKIGGERASFQVLPAPLPRGVGINGTICKMPGNWFLQIGGDVHPSPVIDRYFRIADDVVEPVPISPLPAVQGHGCVYYSGNLYVFGGFKRASPVAECYRYNMASDVWEALAPLPTASGYVTCCVVGDVILVTGYHMNAVYAYLPSHNEFLDLLPLAVREYKTVFTAYTKAFVISGENIYQAQTSALDHFELVGSTAKGLVALSNPPCRQSQLMYFIVGKDELWQYYLKTNTIVRTRN